MTPSRWQSPESSSMAAHWRRPWLNVASMRPGLQIMSPLTDMLGNNRQFLQTSMSFHLLLATTIT